MYNFSSLNSIHGVPDYIFYDFTPDLSLLFTFLPLFYIVPTIAVMLKVYRGYRRMASSLTKNTLDENLFILLMSYFFTNILFFFADYIKFNVPASGLMTSWCARHEPNRFFILIVIITDYLNYSVIILPSMVSLVRVTIMVFCKNDVTTKLVMRWIVFPSLLLIPFLSISFLLPARGYCKQLGPPFEFGAVFFHYQDALLDMRTSYLILFLSLVCCLFSFSLYCIMCCKLRDSLYQSASSLTRKLARQAEMSLTITLVSSVVPFVANTCVSVALIWFPEHAYYFFIVRPVANDFETVLMPWLLYLTHPVFREKKAGKKSLGIAQQAWDVSKQTSS